ncbi:MAG: double-strand break repair protein AddB [Pseudomonadota bacterium]
MSSASPFSAGAQKVWTIPAGDPFLVQFAETLADTSELRDNPAALSDDLIYVPNRRSARSLALALYRAAGETPILPPDIRALGDLETDEPPSGAEEALTDLGPPLSPARRLGALSRLAIKFYEARGETLPVKSALVAGRELARLLDQAALAGGVDWSELPNLVDDADLSVHWQDSVEFLSILTKHWPAWLEESGASEPFDRRLKVAEAVAATLIEHPPKGRFIIAGSTGATPASQKLMWAATKLERGLVVLPGLDLEAPQDSWRAMANEPDHPQHALAGTLSFLGLTASDIPAWPGSDDPQLYARRRLIHESLAPATRTADWLARLKSLSGDRRPRDFAREALAGLSVIQADDEAHEAMLCALMMRQALETEGRTAALVTPDPSLARRVSAALKRWDINVLPSAGAPLGRTRAGSLVLMVLNWIEDTGDPVHLLSLLKHQMVYVSAEAVSYFDRYYMRGPRHWADVADLASRFDAITDQKNASRHTSVPKEATEAVRPLLEFLATAAALMDGHRQQAEAIVAVVDQLTASDTAAWTGTDGAATARTLDAAMEIADLLQTGAHEPLADIFEALASTTTVPEDTSSHPRLAIWGPLEARLQSADQFILAGLNEDIWPDRPAADGFLPRRFREPLELAPPEARLGLAAHDFAGLATATDVTMVYSARRDDAPAIASRWVLRLQTLVRGALGDDTETVLAPPPGCDPRPWADALTHTEGARDPQLAMPRPTPPPSARPKRLSVTRINTLQRDPYAIYAESVLRLRKLGAIDEPLGASARGTAIHGAIESFAELQLQDQTLERLEAFVERDLVRAGQPEHLIVSERASISVATQKLFHWWQDRADAVSKSWSEAEGELQIGISGEVFTLTGIADRIERRADGTLSIIDFKTGGTPTKKAIAAGFEQQLPLLGLIAEANGFHDVDKATTSQLAYVGVKFDFSETLLVSTSDEASSMIQSADEIVRRLIHAYSHEKVPYLSVPRIQLKSAYEGDFDRLARRAEWAGELDDG